MTTTSFELAALVLKALAEGEEISLGSRRVVAATAKDDGHAMLGCIANVWLHGADEPVEETLDLPVSLRAFIQWCEQAVAIQHEVIECVNGAEVHSYFFPENVPTCLRQAAYGRALEALKRDWPLAGNGYPLAVSGCGYSTDNIPLPPCTCCAPEAANAL